jgi:hypothetical protein
MSPVMQLAEAVALALREAFNVAREVLWPLILGFALSTNTSVLNFAFLVFAAVLVWRFLHTGGPEMLRMMNQPVHEHAPHAA